VFIIFWIFSRDANSEKTLIARHALSNQTVVDYVPTLDAIAQETNAYLLTWLGMSFFG
jgi:hypothetical protein